MNLAKVANKLKEFNEKTAIFTTIEKQKDKTKHINAEEFYKDKAMLFEEVKRFLMDSVETLGKIINEDNNKNEEKKKGILEQIKEIKEERQKIMKDTKEIGTNVHEMFQAVTPDGFAKLIAKEIIELLKKINKLDKKVQEKTQDLINNFFTKESKQVMNGLEKIDPKEIQEKGLLAINERVVSALEEAEKLQEKIIKSKILPKEFIEAVKEGSFDKAKEMLEKFSPEDKKIGETFINLANKEKEILSALNNHFEAKANEMGVSRTQAVKMELEDASPTAMKKFNNFLESMEKEMVDKIPVIGIVSRAVQEAPQKTKEREKMLER